MPLLPHTRPCDFALAPSAISRPLSFSRTMWGNAGEPIRVPLPEARAIRYVPVWLALVRTDLAHSNDDELLAEARKMDVQPA